MEKLGQSVDRVRQKITREANCKIDKDLCAESLALIFYERLITIIKPKNQSDRTCFRRISNWILRGISAHEFQAEMFEKVLRFAVEASGPDSRNPAAVFMKILKTELGYGRGKT